MEIYFIGEKETLGNLPTLIDSLGTLIHLDKGSEINAYTDILESKEDKIIVIAPNRLKWEFPVEFIKQVKNLKGIVTRSSWGNYIDLAYCKKNRIIVANSPGANSRAVAEYAVWQMQSLMKKLPLQMKSGFTLGPSLENMTEEATGKVAGIIGLGHIGQNIADLCSASGMDVQYWNRSKKNVTYKAVDLDKLLSTSDIIFKCYAANDDTKEILNEKNLKQVKNSAYFISISGGLGLGGKEDEILLDRIDLGTLAGFSIENEHHKDFNVKDEYKGNVFIPSTLAWYTKETQIRYDGIVADGIRGIIEDKPVNVIV